MAQRDPSRPDVEPAPAASAGTAAQRIEEEKERGRAEAELRETEAGYAERGPRVYTRENSVRFGRTVGSMLGSAVRRLRVMRTSTARQELQSGNLAENAKQFVREHPSSLIGAGAAGFLAGRLLRR